MEISYLRNLRLSADANSEKEAQRDLKESFNKLKAFAVAFGLSTKIETGRCQLDHPIYYYTYIFTIKINAVCDFGSVLELAAAINAFAHFNSFEIGEEIVQLADDES